MPRPRIADDRGASAVEYGLIVFAIAAVIAIALFAFGGSVVGLFGDSCDHIADKAAPATTCG
jgi:pilus assembly protein Flp/PilA